MLKTIPEDVLERYRARVEAKPGKVIWIRGGSDGRWLIHAHDPIAAQKAMALARFEGHSVTTGI